MDTEFVLMNIIFSVKETTATAATDEFSKKPHQKVDETYVQKDDRDEENRTPQHAKRREAKFLPAAKWALVYRALKPLLRPCGDLGEGRLDFYHRSISKAVRQK